MALCLILAKMGTLDWSLMRQTGLSLRGRRRWTFQQMTGGYSAILTFREKVNKPYGSPEDSSRKSCLLKSFPFTASGRLFFFFIKHSCTVYTFVLLVQMCDFPVGGTTPHAVLVRFAPSHLHPVCSDQDNNAICTAHPRFVLILIGGFPPQTSPKEVHIGLDSCILS